VEEKDGAERDQEDAKSAPAPARLRQLADTGGNQDDGPPLPQRAGVVDVQGVEQEEHADQEDDEAEHKA